MISIGSKCEMTIREIIKRTPVRDLTDAEEILRRCLLRSEEVRYGFVDNELACVWGLIPPTCLSDTAYLWLLTTEIVAEHKFLFIRHSQRYIEEALKTYNCIVGDVAIDNEPAKRWLRWLGARMDNPSGGRMNFTIRRK